MSTTVSRPDAVPASSVARAASPATKRARTQRAIFLVFVAAALAGGFLVTGAPAVARAVDAAGEDLTRLLRGMALLKALMAAFVIGGVVWRLGVPASRARLAFYAAACGVMAAGPGLIWGMEHVRAGAFFLHAGLAVSLVVLWRDPAVSARLAGLLRSRRAQ